MKRGVVEVYALGVCFFAAAVLAVALAAAGWDVVEVAAPEFALDGRVYECHQTDDAFALCHRQGELGFYRGDEPVDLPAGAGLTSMREESFRRAVNVLRRDALQGLVQKGIVAFVMMLLFGVHWRLRRVMVANHP